MNSVVKIEQYTALGEQEFLDQYGFPVTSDENRAYAKTLFFEDGKKHHYILQNRQGAPFDPALDKFEPRSPYDVRYKQVDYKTFNMYKLYLKKRLKNIYQDVVRRCV